MKFKANWRNWALGLLLLPGLLKATDAGARFLTLEMDARVRAAGSAAAGAGLGVESLHSNPAGLATAGDIQASLSHFMDAADWSHDSLSFAMPLGASVLAVEASLSRVAPVTYYAPNGDVAGSISAGDSGLGISWAMASKGGDLRVGMTARGFQSNIASYNSYGFAVDAGGQYRVWDSLTLGLALLNLGEQSAYVSTVDPLPMGAKVGAAWQLPENDVAAFELRGDYNYFPQAGWVPPVALGVEATFQKLLTLSAGLQLVSDRTLFSFGGGIQAYHFMLSYAFVPDSLVGDSHLITLTMLGLPGN